VFIPVREVSHQGVCAIW